jgi:hypothetical protein
LKYGLDGDGDGDVDSDAGAQVRDGWPLQRAN